MIDVSSNMATMSTPGGPSYEAELTKAASIGLSLFANTSNLGLWEYGSDLNGTLPYKQLVSMGPLPAQVGVLSRRDQLSHIASNLTAGTSPRVALYGSILAGYKYMLSTYRPNFFNGVVVLGSGIENDSSDISAADLIKKLNKLNEPSRKVNVIIIVFGDPPNFPQLKQIAQVTGGAAYEISKPSQVDEVFYKALAHRLCDLSCLAP